MSQDSRMGLFAGALGLFGTEDVVDEFDLMNNRGGSWDALTDWIFGGLRVDYDWNSTSDAAKLVKQLMAAEAPNASTHFVDVTNRTMHVPLVNPPSTSQFFSNLRESFYAPESSDWGVSHVLIELRPEQYENRAPGIKPQQGVSLRNQQDTKFRHVVAWYDVVVGNPHVVNAGVWSVNLDGSGFLNRQANKAMLLNQGMTITAAERTGGIVTATGLNSPDLKVDDWINVIYTKIIASGVSMTRSGNVVTATGLPVGHGIPADGMITVDLGSPSSFNITEVEIQSAPTSTSLTWNQSGSNESGTGRIRDKSNDRRPARVIEIVDATTFKYEDLGQNRDLPASTGNADMTVLMTSSSVVNRIFPYWMEAKVVGTVFYVRCWNRNQTVPPWGDPDRSIVTDLDFPTTTLTVNDSQRVSNVATLFITETATLSKLLVGGRIDVNLTDNTYDTTTATITAIDIGNSSVSYIDVGTDDAVGSTGTATVYGGSTAASIADNPTPKGTGAIGFVAAHQGYDDRAHCIYGPFYGDNQLDSQIIMSASAPAGEVALETEVVQPLKVIKSRTLGQATETEVAQFIHDIKAVTQVTETEVVNAITRVKTKAAGQATETETVTTLTKSKLRAVGQTTEAEVAQAINEAKTRAVGQAVETEIAQTIEAPSNDTILVGQVVETERVQRLAVPVGRAVETEVVNPVTRIKTKAAGQATETEVAQTVNEAKTRAVGQATETEVAQVVNEFKTKAIGQALETELVTRLGVIVPRVVETEVVQALTKLKTKAIGQTTETEVAQTLTRRKTITLGQVAETEVANAITFTSGGIIETAIENETVTALSKFKVKTVIDVSETETVTALGRSKVKSAGTATEVEQAQQIRPNKVIPLGAVTETETVSVVAKRKTAQVSQVVEVEIVNEAENIVGVLVGTAVENEVTQGLTKFKLTFLANVVETEFVPNITPVKRRTLGQVVETETGFGVAHTKSRTVQTSVEVETVGQAKPFGGSPGTAGTGEIVYSETGSAGLVHREAAGTGMVYRE